MYQFLMTFHKVTSSIFIFVAITLIIRSVLGWWKNWRYSGIDKILSATLLTTLYLSLIHGIIIYFFIDPSAKSAAGDIHQAMKHASLRFWGVEHFYMMSFALILAQIGRIFIRKTSVDKSRFAYAAFYYGIATLITLLSILFYFMYR